MRRTHHPLRLPAAAAVGLRPPTLCVSWSSAERSNLFNFPDGAVARLHQATLPYMVYFPYDFRHRLHMHHWHRGPSRFLWFFIGAGAATSAPGEGSQAGVLAAAAAPRTAESPPREPGAGVKWCA